MNTLFLAWRSGYTVGVTKSPKANWFPIGRLDKASEGEGSYTFRYLKGAKLAAAQAGFSALEAFPDLKEVYTSPELFSVFSNRIPNPRRSDFSKIVERMDLSERADAFNILSVSGGARQTDTLEIFPLLKTSTDGDFVCKFFIHGSRFMHESSNHALDSLTLGQELRVCFEANNPATGWAIQLQTVEKPLVIGYVPRYLLPDLNTIRKSDNQEFLSAFVCKINPAPAPLNQRFLVELRGRLPEGHVMMSSTEFESIS